MIIKNKQGEKMYPVCSWERNQHKLYNAHDRAMNALDDGTGTYTEVLRVEDALNAFEANVVGDLVYATWNDLQLIRSYIGAYNARH